MNLVVRFICRECGRERKGVAEGFPLVFLEGYDWHPHTEDCSSVDQELIIQVYEGEYEDVPPSID